MLKTLKRLLLPTPGLPEKWRNTQWSEVPLLSIDLELTSLDVKTAEILSIGWVQGQACQIAISSCHYQVIHTKASLNQSPTIHGLIAEDIQQGQHVRQALEQLLKYADSHIWVFHHAGLDMAVIKNVAAKLHLNIPSLVTLDTLRLAVYKLKKYDSVHYPNAATLASCRQRYNLPIAPAHNALEDAMATLELLFAQLSDFDPSLKEPLQSLKRTKALRVFID